MAHIRYMAVLSDKPEELARFYQDQIGFRELKRSNQNDISLTDGFYNFAILNRRAELSEPRMEVGLHHIGLQVASIDETLTRYKRLYPRGLIVTEPHDPYHGQVRIFDPEANPVTLSEDGFGAGKGEQRAPRIVHVALNALIPETILQFYCDIFDFKEISSSFSWRQDGKQNRFAGDGVTNLAIHPFYTNSEGHEARMGINHFGILVEDMVGKLNGLKSIVPVADRPSVRPFAEHRMKDPDGNGVDFSQHKGWEVSRNKWDKVA